MFSSRILLMPLIVSTPSSSELSLYCHRKSERMDSSTCRSNRCKRQARKQMMTIGANHIGQDSLNLEFEIYWSFDWELSRQRASKVRKMHLHLREERINLIYKSHFQSFSSLVKSSCLKRRKWHHWVEKLVNLWSRFQSNEHLTMMGKKRKDEK